MKDTMKKLTVFVAVGLFGALLAAPQNAGATPFQLGAIDVEGYVDPVNATVVDNGDGTSTFSDLAYRFDVVATNNSRVHFVQIGFETDVFDLSGYSLTSTDPADWMQLPDSAVGDFHNLAFIAGFFGTLLDAGDRFAFTLDDVIVQNAALGDPAFWNEGQIWAQPWVAAGTHFAFDGGSTAPVPEPGTMLLLGSGLLGMALWGRRRAPRA
ncbi:MAG: PEP-CTERM sorting domain-containing protein [Nitrospirae bacterium]|nr:PEP-CTERM sorting domain-containing protein [Nitrospirota bacterium]